MKMNELTPEQQKLVKEELDIDNKEGVLHQIIQVIENEFGDEGSWYALDPEGLRILSESLYKCEDSLLYCDSEIEEKYFDFNRDICDVYELIRHNIVRETTPEENEPVLVVNSDEIITTIEYTVDEYLNGREE